MVHRIAEEIEEYSGPLCRAVTVVDDVVILPLSVPEKPPRGTPERVLHAGLCRLVSQYMRAKAASGGATDRDRQVVQVVLDAAAMVIDDPEWGELEE